MLWAQKANKHNFARRQACEVLNLW